MTKMKTKKMAMTTAPMMTTASTRNWLAKKFAELRAQYVVTRDTIKAKGRSHATAQEEILKLSEVFKQFRLVPKQFDYLVNSMRVHDGPRSYARTSDHEALR
ncbi:RNA polymerase [Escherichia coli]|uniref:RNA polymerase n=1 Tax=Escherichia coli TaxID=562 RepID=A0A377C0Y4_ECOLX|nr:RNA polymerase [Escherichia coli]